MLSRGRAAQHDGATRNTPREKQMQAAEYEKMRRRQAIDRETKSLADEIVSISGCGHNAEHRESLIDHILRDHRTNQQNVMRFVFAFIEAMAEQQHDLRNEASVSLAKQIIDKIEDRHLPYI
jgi:hypothetical protein